jgi:hypothetical protein
MNTFKRWAVVLTALFLLPKCSSTGLEIRRMAHSRKLVKCRFLPYLQARTSRPPEGKGTLWIDVSSSGEPPYDRFSPFYPHGGIPIPGMENRTSDSVEGIWQGLKVIRGEIAPRFFEGAGRKRVGKPAGHQFGDQKRLLDLAEARRKIYIPAYEWMLTNRIDSEILEAIISKAFRGIPQFFFDREDNASIGKDRPLAHASLLVDYINCIIDERLGKEPPTSAGR